MASCLHSCTTASRALLRKLKYLYPINTHTDAAQTSASPG
jgi:hypothetical protein